MSKDHKRKARAVPAAVVRCYPGEIVVIVPDVLSKNESHKTGEGGKRHTSEATRYYRESVNLGAVRWRADEAIVAAACGTSTMHHSQAMAGAWRLEVLAVWPRKRDVIKGRPVDFAPVPMGDADAAIPQALDALQYARILDDDARVVEVRAWNLYRKEQRYTVIRLSRVADLAARDGAIAHLLAELPADVQTAAEPDAKPKRRASRPRPPRQPAPVEPAP